LVDIDGYVHLTNPSNAICFWLEQSFMRLVLSGDVNGPLEPLEAFYERPSEPGQSNNPTLGKYGIPKSVEKYGFRNRISKSRSDMGIGLMTSGRAM
jgi:hypothetical protein